MSASQSIGSVWDTPIELIDEDVQFPDKSEQEKMSCSEQSRQTPTTRIRKQNEEENDVPSIPPNKVLRPNET